MTQQRSLGDVIDDLARAFSTENGPEFHRLVQLLHLSITPQQEQVKYELTPAQLQPFAHGALASYKPPLDPHLQHIERMLLQGLYYLSAIYAQNRRLLMKAADINAKLDRIDQATNNIAADVRFLASQIGTGMTQEQVDAVGARLEAAAGALEAVAAATPDQTAAAGTGDSGAPVKPATEPEGSTFSGETGAGTQGRVTG